MTALVAPEYAPSAHAEAASRSSVAVQHPSRHAWFPWSSCGDQCREDDLARSAGRVLVAARVARLIMITIALAITAPVILLAPRIVRRWYLRRASYRLLAALGITVQIDDRRPFAGRVRGLVVANHISYLDILALAVISPAHFVAKSEVAQIPVISGLVRWLGVITIERESLRGLPDTIARAVDGLHRDSSVAVFPEGTTRCGYEPGRFRPAFFQAAIDAGVPVTPIRLRFTTPGGATATEPSFIGDDTPAATLRRVLRMRGLTVHIRVHEIELPDADRRSLAARCERIVAAPPAAGWW
ncbi:lysophospholipid acyltransferase family protein [Gordonia rhizosphera]|uniref:1-acylglycerol-3-phosphate O-acyltransferase n=1 Tax=Gordonia rhizosphera NBRC 16068 TaxID=1108045 RepID=K6WU11_9ACTN|nr:lysophospholipid acyltransferase family protein [Gordonia rhizosphera]GAB90054.1 1-acylglycerol-3-phosphate O-acyltransferase [Gordonia rhizosphera NBRC 16068]